jgi:hypothetical protein
MIDANVNPAKELMPIALSWIIPPKLSMDGLEPSYTVDTYDPAQKTYVLQCGVKGPSTVEFTLLTSEEDDEEEEWENEVIREEIDFQDLPSIIQKEVRKEYPNQSPEGVERTQEDEEVFYGVWFIVNGKEVGLGYNADGELVERWPEVDNEAEDEEDEEFEEEMQRAIVNPAIVMKDWGDAGVTLKINGKSIKPGKDFRVGYEETHTGKDLVLWLKMKTVKTTRFTLEPVRK